MPKRFKTKKKHRILKIGLMLLVIYFSFLMTFKYFTRSVSSVTIDSNKYLKYVLKTGFNNQVLNYNFFNLFSVSSLLDQSLNADVSVDENSIPVGEVIKEEETIPLEPKVYIYNTHQSEEYKRGTLEAYNIAPTVLLTSYYLAEKLNDYGVPTLLETSSISEILKNNSWNYASSYKASRILLEQAYQKYPSLEFFIDFHRDSSVYSKTTFQIEDKNYVKILFIVGEENQDYEKNLALTTELNNRFKEINPEISRGIYRKKGPGVNGVYNQDFHPNTILMEFGGQYNSMEEVCNTLDLISKTLADYIKEIYGKEETQ